MSPLGIFAAGFIAGMGLMLLVVIVVGIRWEKVLDKGETRHGKGT